jgi:hypothetical protein
MRFLFPIVICAVLASAAVHSFSGKITDPSGAAVPGASVEAVAAGRGTIARTRTDSQGEFHLASLTDGDYEIVVARAGFETQRRNIHIGAETVALHIALPIGKQQYAVTVEDKPKLDPATESHADAFVLKQENLNNLPMKDGDVLTALSSFVNPAGGASPTIIVDGMERTAADLPLSSIEQVRINNNAYSAEFPKPGKGRIEIDTRGGTDDYHGGFLARARNSIFDARNPLAPDKLPFSRYGYEVNLGGPIFRKRLFFFIDANREQQQQSQPVLAYLPSGLMTTDLLAPVTHDRFVGRLDWQASQSHRLTAKYEFHLDRSANAGVGGFALPSLATTVFHRDYRIELSDQYVFSPDLLNTFRIALGTNYQRVSSANAAPLITVQGAFSDGGAQVNEWRREPRTDMVDTLSYSKGPTTIKFGAIANFHPFQTYNADNFGGTYTFASLAAYEAGQPALFTLSAGNPALSFQQNDYGWFAQYERKIESKLGAMSLCAGVRHEFQSGVSRFGDLAPRLAMALAPGKDHRTVIRLGAGVFFDRRPPPLLEQTLRYDGIQTNQYIVTNPTYPVDNMPALQTPQSSAVWRFDPSLTLPRVYQASATLERQLPGGFMLVSDYTYQRGSHLLRARNINAPMPDSGLQPYPGQGYIYQFESSASSRGDVLNWTLRSPPNRRFQFFAQYSLSWLDDDTGAAFPPAPGSPASLGSLFSSLLPANNYDLRTEWGRSNNDARHRLGLSGTVQLPWHLTFGTLATLRSGLPFNITTGLDNNGDGVANDRPVGVSRNTGQGPGQLSVDVHLGRKWTLHLGDRPIDAEVGLDSFNVLNHANFNSYVGVLTSPLFGEPNSALDGRQMQFTFNVHF